MALENLDNEYFDWMYDLVCENKRASYRKLLRYLYDREFTYTIEMDDNRAEDGVDLRYRFAYGRRYRDPTVVAKTLNDRPCSVLEMMVALAIRCEEQIMDDPDIGNRTDRWFWDMIDNLGLSSMSDTRYNDRYVHKTIDRFLNREYKANGEGGLFTVKNCKYDLRTVEIWYQMNWYLNDI